MINHLVDGDQFCAGTPFQLRDGNILVFINLATASDPQTPVRLNSLPPHAVVLCDPVKESVDLAILTTAAELRRTGHGVQLHTEDIGLKEAFAAKYEPASANWRSDLNQKQQRYELRDLRTVVSSLPPSSLATAVFGTSFPDPSRPHWSAQLAAVLDTPPRQLVFPFGVCTTPAAQAMVQWTIALADAKPGLPTPAWFVPIPSSIVGKVVPRNALPGYLFVRSNDACGWIGLKHECPGVINSCLKSMTRRPEAPPEELETALRHRAASNGTTHSANACIVFKSATPQQWTLAAKRLDHFHYPSVLCHKDLRVRDYLSSWITDPHILGLADNKLTAILTSLTNTNRPFARIWKDITLRPCRLAARGGTPVSVWAPFPLDLGDCVEVLVADNDPEATEAGVVIGQAPAGRSVRRVVGLLERSARQAAVRARDTGRKLSLIVSACLHPLVYRLEVQPLGTG